MGSCFDLDDVFPIIARLIGETEVEPGAYVEHDDLLRALLGDTEAVAVIEDAHSRCPQRSLEDLTSNMIAWFSQKITVGDSPWKDDFERAKVRRKWAYRPAQL